MDAIIATSTAGFATAFASINGSLTYAGLLTFMKTWLLYILGAGLGVLQSLMPYIVGLVVISAIIYFLYRAFKFFRH